MKDKAWIEKHIAQNMQKNLKTQQQEDTSLKINRRPRESPHRR